jgi:recombination protein RecT
MGELLPMKVRMDSTRSMLERMKGDLIAALPKELGADAFLQVVLTSVARTPKLLDCTPASFLGAVRQCAQLGLVPDGVLGECALVPYGTVCTLLPMYKGLLKLCYQSGVVEMVEVRTVFEGDTFHYEYGLKPILVHKPCGYSERGKPTHYYCISRIKESENPLFDVMTYEDVEAIRKQYSRASSDGPWVTAFDSMAMKTILRRTMKLLPKSRENLSRAIALDERAEVGVPQEIDIPLEAEFDKTGEQKPPETKLEKLKVKIKEQAPQTKPSVAPEAPKTQAPPEHVPAPQEKAPAAPAAVIQEEKEETQEAERIEQEPEPETTPPQSPEEKKERFGQESINKVQMLMELANKKKISLEEVDEYARDKYGKSVMRLDKESIDSVIDRVNNWPLKTPFFVKKA